MAANVSERKTGESMQAPDASRAPAAEALLEKVYFRYAGKVGTGFSAAMRRKLWSLLRKDVVSTPPVIDPPRQRKSSWVTPRYVAQVAFTEWTRDGRLRHPSFRGLRDDKSPEDCWRERPGALPRQTCTGAAR